MRTIKELLILLKEKYKKNNDWGLCNALKYSPYPLPFEEYYTLLQYMKDHRPGSKYYDHNNRITSDPEQFWYKIGDKLNRYRWLNKHIKLNT
jgi:hypothetical protein